MQHGQISSINMYRRLLLSLVPGEQTLDRKCITKQMGMNRPKIIEMRAIRQLSPRADVPDDAPVAVVCF